MLEITAKHIAALDDADLRELIGRLCEAELRSLGLSTSYVTYGGAQDAPDGGLDVRVEIPQGRQIEGYIPRPSTGFQVKATAMGPAKIKAEMRPNGTVRPVIEELADNSGSYILISSKESTGDKPLRHRIQAMQDAIRDIPNRDSLDVNFYDQKKVASWLRSHPGIIPWVREKIGQPIRGWSSYGNWSKSPAGLPDSYLRDDHARLRDRTGPGQEDLSVLEGIAKIRARLSQPSGIVRLVGLSGVGKTRFVQALFDETVCAEALAQSKALYADLSESPDPQPHDLLHQLLANGDSIILVVDNCPPEVHSRLSKILLANHSIASLLTVEYDVRGDDLPEDTGVFELRSSSESLIEDLLKRRFPQLSQVNAQTIAQMADGNARMALALARGVGNRRGIARLSEDDLFQRIFMQRNEPDNAFLAAAQVFSLVYSFDGEDTSPTSELAILGSLICKSPSEMYACTAELLRRDLLQRRSKWRALLPHAIANRLAATALENFPTDRIQTFLLEESSARMLKSFSRRLNYLHTSQAAVSIAEAWLAKEGLVGDIASLNDLGREVFRNLAPVAPESALSAIERGILVSLNAESAQPLTFCAGILRSIAYEPALFQRSALSLAKLAQMANSYLGTKEEEKVFASLFHIYLSGTKATIDQRLAVIEQLLGSGETDRRLGFLALKAALKTQGMGTHYSFDFGGHSRDFGLHPMTKEDIQHWYASTLDLCEKFVFFGSASRAEVMAAVAAELRGMWSTDCVYNELEAFCAARASEGFWADGLHAIQETLYYHAHEMTPEIRLRLETLESLLSPKNLAQQVRDTVLNPHHTLYTTGQRYGSEGDTATQDLRVDQLANSLGVAAAKDRESFDELLPEMFERGSRIWSFGTGLAFGTSDPLRLWQTMVSQFSKNPESSGNPQILCAFVSSLAKKEPELAARILDDSLIHDVLGKIFPALQTCVDADPKRYQRLIRCLQLGITRGDSFGYLRYPGAGDKFTPSEFRELVIRIAAMLDGFEVAVNVLNMRLTHGQYRGMDSEKLVLDAGRVLLKSLELKSNNLHIDFELGQTVMRCLTEDSDAVIVRQIARKLFDAMSTFKASSHEHTQLLAALFRSFPIAVLDELAAITSDRAWGVFPIFHNLGGMAHSALSSLPEDTVISWCEQEPSRRYLLAAEAVAVTENDADGRPAKWTRTAIRILRQAPDRSAVLQRFISRSKPISFWSSLAAAFEPSAKLLEELKREFNDDSMLACIEEERLRLAQFIAAHRQIEDNGARGETSFE